MSYKSVSSTPLKNSVHRPHVGAGDRLSAWTTPFSLDYQESIRLAFPNVDRHRVVQVALASLAPATRKTYGSGLLRFSQFCDLHNISEVERMPASAQLLASFLAELAAGSVAHETAKNWLAGVHFWHTIYDAKWHGNRDLVSAVKGGVKKMAPSCSHRAQRQPVTIDHIYALRHSLSPSNSRDIAVLALAETAFWGICRLGELTVSSSSSFDSSYHVSMSAKYSLERNRDGAQFLKLPIPWSKTEGFVGANIILSGREDLSNPIQSFTRHMKINGALVPSTAPLFSYETSSGWVSLTKTSFMDICNNIWTKAGLTCVSGHSFRIGGTTEYLLQGVPPDVVAALGRWKSRAFLRYWRKVEEIIPTFVANSTRGESSLLSVVHTMSVYKNIHAN